MEHQVTFVKDAERWVVVVPEGSTLLQAAARVEAPVHTLCNGVGTCTQCKVVVEGPTPALTPPNALEKDRLGNVFHLTGERLACQARVLGPVEVRTTEVRLPRKKGRVTGTPPAR